MKGVAIADPGGCSRDSPCPSVPFPAIPHAVSASTKTGPPDAPKRERDEGWGVGGREIGGGDRRGREIERGGERGGEREGGERLTDRHTERDRDRETETDRDRQTERDRNRTGKGSG